uniref:Uncharacterized protein n=1 Tax=Oryza punctata TaxID=4537 RepID=A0A0E0JER7_ORYPU
MASAESGDVPTVKYFLIMVAISLSKGVPVDIDCGFGTPLFNAANNGKDKTLKILLDCQADPNVIVNNGSCSPLMSALDCCSLKCMKLLIKASTGADVNVKGTIIAPLVFSTLQGGYTNFIKILLETGAIPNIPDDVSLLFLEFCYSSDYFTNKLRLL